MDDKWKLTMELLELMEDMSPEQIGMVRTEWTEMYASKEPARWESAKRFIDAITTTAIRRAMAKSKTA